MELETIKEYLVKELAAITNRPPESFNEASGLIGSESVVASREFVELLLAAEDFANQQLGVAFDWTSDSAMSEARSQYRTVGSLAEHLLQLSKSRSAN